MRLNVIASRFCQQACEDSAVHDANQCRWHRLDQVSRAEGKDLSFLVDVPLVIEVPPVMKPRFERTLETLVTPALASGQKVAVVCLPSVRRMTQKATWIDHWNRRSGRHFKFVNRCMCAFSPDTSEHRTVFVGTNADLPEHMRKDITQRQYRWHGKSMHGSDHHSSCGIGWMCFWSEGRLS